MLNGLTSNNNNNNNNNNSTSTSSSSSQYPAAAVSIQQQQSVSSSSSQYPAAAVSIQQQSVSSSSSQYPAAVSIQQQSVSSAILATTQRSARNTDTLIINNHTYLQKCIQVSFVGINIHGIRVGYFYAVLKDGSLIVDQYLRNESFERRRKRLTKHCFSYCDRLLRPLCLFFIFVMVSGLWSVLCSRTRYASILLASYLD